MNPSFPFLLKTWCLVGKAATLSGVETEKKKIKSSCDLRSPSSLVQDGSSSSILVMTPSANFLPCHFCLNYRILLKLYVNLHSVAGTVTHR